MLTERRKEPRPDPEQKLIGQCATCNTVCECLRWQARPAQEDSPHLLTMPGGDPFGWSMPSMACTKCGATVYLGVKKEQQ